MWTTRRTLVVGWCVVMSAALGSVGSARAADSVCASVLGRADVSAPTKTAAWRAGIEGRTAVLDHLPAKRWQPSDWISPTDASWVMVIARPRHADHRCWLQVRLPWRPNSAAGWVNARNVLLAKTRWRIDVSTPSRTLTLFRSGTPVRTVSVVVGKPSTPTPVGLFSVVWAIPWHPTDFLGSWVLELTAHSDVLQQFDGGDGTVGIHGRGGTSLLDPLGSAASHGCIRLSNDTIDWLVQTVGANQVPGIPVVVR